MEINWDEVRGTVEQWPPLLAYGVPILTALLVVGLTIYLINASINALKDKSFSFKLEIGFTVVQAVVTYEIMDGVYDFFRHVIGNPQTQSLIMAVFFEGAVWTSVGFILVHGRTLVPKIGKDGEPVLGGDGNPVMVNQMGWGLGGPFFWVFTVAGGILAIIGARTGDVAIGRAVVVVFGASLWVLRLMIKTHRNTRRSRFAFSPRRILERKGWIEPEPDETQDENLEWRIAQLAKAIRLTNGNRWQKWVGKRALVRLAETTDEATMRAAQLRCAQVYVLQEQASYKSVTMTAAIASVEKTTTAIAEIHQQATLKAAIAAADRMALPADDDIDQADEMTIRPVPSRPGYSTITFDPPPQRRAPRGQAARAAGGAQVSSLAKQVEADQLAARTILHIVEREMTKKLGETVRYQSWDDVRTAIRENPDVISFNKIEELSKKTDCPMGKPKITKRIVPNAENLHPLPGDMEVERAG